MSEDKRLLTIHDLHTHFHTDDGVVRAVDGVTLKVDRGKIVGIVGESGCGKSVLGLSILRLVPRPGRIVSGSIVYHGLNGSQPVDITSLHPESEAMRAIRGNEISMIFQEPMAALSPVYTVGEQIIEAIQLHRPVRRQEARKRALELLQKVGIPDPAQRLDEYPFRLSGGMRQRVLIAIALACDPKLLIADEPTTALDVTVQAQILRLIKSLQAESGMSVLMITHDLGVVASMADEVVVMYLGKIVEAGSVRDIFRRPQHPYTLGLLNSVPRIGSRKRLVSIRGSVPSPQDVPVGCRFINRCPFAMKQCETEPPEFEVGNGHVSKCWLNEGGKRHERRVDPA